MGTLEGLLKYQNLDSTEDLNRRLLGAVNKGVYDASTLLGLTDPDVGTNTQLVTPGVGMDVDVAAFTAMGFDAMVTLHTGSSNVPLIANTLQYVVLRTKYNPSGAPVLQFEAIDIPDYNADPDKDYLIILAKVNAPVVPPVLNTHIDLRENHIVNPISRGFIRGVVQAFANLPVDVAADRIVTGDVYLVINDRQFYRWNGAIWETVTDGAVMTAITNHITDPTAAHAASAISFSPTGTIAATDVQGAVAEVGLEKVAKAGDSMTGALSVAAVLPAAILVQSTNSAAGSGTALKGTGFTGVHAVGTGTGTAALAYNSGSGPGLEAYGGTASAVGVLAIGGSPNGVGVVAVAAAASPPIIVNNAGVQALGASTGTGVYSVGGSSAGGNGIGVTATGGSNAGLTTGGYGIFAGGGDGQTVTAAFLGGTGGYFAGGLPSGIGVLVQAGGTNVNTIPGGVGGDFLGGGASGTGLAAKGGNGINVTGGGSVNADGGIGVFATGGNSSVAFGGVGVYAVGGSENGIGVRGIGGTTNGTGVRGDGTGTGFGVHAENGLKINTGGFTWIEGGRGKVRKTANQLIGGTSATDITWNTIDTNSGGVTLSSPDVAIANAGIYLVSYTLVVDIGVTGVITMNSSATLNGSYIEGAGSGIYIQSNTSGDVRTLNGTFLVNVSSASSNIRLRITVDTASAFNVLGSAGSTSTTLSVFRIAT